MEKEMIFLKIDTYIDGELKQSDEESLFAELALDAEARKYLRGLTLLKQSSAGYDSEFPEQLEEKILSATTLKDYTVIRNSSSMNLYKYISIGVSLILLVASLLFYSSMNEYRNEVKNVVNHIEQQQELIKVLYNTLPAAEVRATYSNEIIVKPNS